MNVSLPIDLHPAGLQAPRLSAVGDPHTPPIPLDSEALWDLDSQLWDGSSELILQWAGGTRSPTVLGLRQKQVQLI